MTSPTTEIIHSPFPACPIVSRTQSAGAAHIPSLDGLRAVAVALVLLGHLSGTHGFVSINLGIGDYAHLGVVVFFVISGFLITRLLLSEQTKKGSVSLKLFYLRRSLRLFPAAYAFIASVSLLWLAGIVHLEARDLWHAVTYTVNYLPGRSWYLGHLWSLSVEEQFYLLWPCTFVMLGPRRASWVVGGVILFGPVARIGARVFLIGTPYRDLEMFPMVADSLAVGCLWARVGGWLKAQGLVSAVVPACLLVWIVSVDLASQSLRRLYGGRGLRHVNHQHQSRDSHSPLCLLLARPDWTSPQLEANCVRGCSQLFALPVAAAFS